MESEEKKILCFFFFEKWLWDRKFNVVLNEASVYPLSQEGWKTIKELLLILSIMLTKEQISSDLPLW